MISSEKSATFRDHALAAAAARLDRRATNATVGTEHATVAELRFQPGAAALAIVEELAGIDRHALGFPMAAAGTGQLGFQNHASIGLEIRPSLNPPGYSRL
jgi:hypothetical protein